MGTRPFIYLIMASLILAACGTGRVASEVTAPVEVARPLTADGRYSAATGRALYIQHCALCHGDEGRGDGPTAEALDPKPAAFTDRELRVSRTPAERFEIITNGAIGAAMPAWAAVMNEDQRWAILYFEWSLATSRKDIAAGKLIFETNCAVCHGESGQGDGPSADSLDTQPASFADHEFMADRSDRDLYKAISEGKPPMPEWGGVLTEEQRWQVIAYMRTFTYQPVEPSLAFAEPMARAEGEPPKFRQDVLPILVANCVRCHSGDSAPNGLRLTDYATVMKGSLFLPVVRPAAPESSPLYLTTSKATMPADGQPLNQTQVQTIYDWIEAGAPDN